MTNPAADLQRTRKDLVIYVVEKTIGTMLSNFFSEKTKKGNTSVESGKEKYRFSLLDRFSTIRRKGFERPSNWEIKNIL